MMKTWRQAPELGLGLVYMHGFDAVFAAAGPLIDFVEVEPQQHWLRSSAPEAPPKLDRAQFARIRALDRPVVMHSVGCPIGGHVDGLGTQARALRESIARLDPPWVSEHLAFNAFRRNGVIEQAGFLLPPLPCAESVALAARNLRHLAEVAQRPVAFETGVNYLRPRAGEWRDGEFVAAVAEAADCAIVLDLHNVWTNARNGRQSVAEFMAEIPLERVIEVHVAGGEALDGYWLDAHSGLAPPELMSLAREWLPRLPALRALTFEMMGEALGRHGLDTDALCAHLEQWREIWALRGTRAEAAPRLAPPIATHDPRLQRFARDRAPCSVAQWEYALGTSVGHRPGYDAVSEVLRADPGVAILRQLVDAARAGTAVTVLPYSTRLIGLARGQRCLHERLEAFWSQHAPAMFPTQEILSFAEHLRASRLDIPGLDEMLDLETATLRARVDGTAQRLRLAYDPADIVAAIEAGRIPTLGEPGALELRIEGMARAA